jgi:hypothetical protein
MELKIFKAQNGFIIQITKTEEVPRFIVARTFSELCNLLGELFEVPGESPTPTTVT